MPLAFLAGLLSFASPCVLPLVPAYLGYLGSTTAAGVQPQAGHRSRAPVTHALAFVLGFMLVFILMGASATLIGQVLLDYRPLLQRVGSVLLVIFGIRLMSARFTRRSWAAAAVAAGLLVFILNSGWLAGSLIQLDGGSLFRWLVESLMVSAVVLAGAELALPWQVFLGVAAGVFNMLASPDDPGARLAASLLIAAAVILLNRAEIFYAEKRLELAPGRKNTIGWSFLFGLVFAAGWTPCIGPILAGILVVASQMDTVSQGVLFLTAYSLGLGIPFLLFGLAFGPLSKVLGRMKRSLGITSIISGILLALMGILLLTGSLDFLARYGSFFNLGL